MDLLVSFILILKKTILQEFSTSYGFSDSSPAITSNAEKIYFVSDVSEINEIYLAEYEKFQKIPLIPWISR